MRAARAAVLEAKGLSYALGSVPIIKDFHLRIEAGQVLGLIGPNGAGKTTLLDLLSGLAFPDRGAVFLNGGDITRLAPYRRARLGLARTFQESPAVADMTVREHLELACDCTRIQGTAHPATSPSRLLAMFGLADLAGRRGARLPTLHR